MPKAPKAEVEVTAESRTLGAKLREIRQKFVTFGSELRKGIGGKVGEDGFLSKAGATAFGQLSAQALSAAGSFLLDQGKDVLSFNDNLKRLQITASESDSTMTAFGAAIRSTSSSTGIGAAEILEGASAYVALTGDMAGAIKAQEQWARVAQATNSQVKDIAGTAAALKQQLDIKPEQMEQTFSALAAQGKAGAIELKDLASQLQSIAPQWAEFGGGKGVQGVKELGAALQIVKRGFGGDASETVTGLQSLLNAYVKNAARLKKGNIQIFEKDPVTGVKHLRNVLDITKDLGNSKLAKDPTKLEKALGRVEAYRAYLQLKNNRDELEKMIEVGNDAGLIGRDLGTYMESSAGRTKKAWQQAKNEIAESFTPERIEIFTRLVVDATKVAARLASVVSGILDKAHGFGEWAAKLLGYETEDDKASRTQAETRAKRVAAVKARKARKMKLGPGGVPIGYEFMSLTDSESEAAVDAEDQAARDLKSRVDQGKPQATGSLSGPGFPAPFGPTAGPTSFTPYSPEELARMRVDASTGGATNAKGLNNILDAAMQRQIKANQDFLRDLSKVLTTGGGPTFKVGDDTIHASGARAPGQARRPNGP